MTLLCLLGGCSWAAGTEVIMGREAMLCQVCSRCGACRYLPLVP
ncbi:PSPA7_2676 family Cys-rich small protein [Metapseudomonas otitidis]|nr:PSPA7_2676 family Cys-rich small protein [Pseudomonas otitidis]